MGRELSKEWLQEKEEYLATNLFGQPFEESDAGDTGLAYYDPPFHAPGVDCVSWQRIHQLKAFEHIKLFYHEKVNFHNSFVALNVFKVVRPCIPSLISNTMDIDITHLWDGQHCIRNQPFCWVQHGSAVTAKYWVTFTLPTTGAAVTIKLRFVEYPCPYWLAGRTKTGAFVLFCNHPETYGGMQLFIETGISDEFIESKTSENFF